MNLEDCLPVNLRGPTTTITPVAAGLSGAGVYRVEHLGQSFVLKISSEEAAIWRSKLHIQRLASNAGLAPRIVHTDEAHRAVVSVFVMDRSFFVLYASPPTHEAALTQLGRLIRRVHQLPVPPDAEPKRGLDFLSTTWSGLSTDFALPTFVSEAVQRILTEETPASERSFVLSHNDVNPTNLLYDGQDLMLVDWEVAGLNDPFYDLAAISVFLRMDEKACQKLLSVYDDTQVAKLPDRFLYSRRLVAVLCGVVFLHLARQNGYAETLGSAPSLGEVYQRLRAGSLQVSTGEGQWSFGLALLKESLINF